MLHVFIDTNVFLHFELFDQIKWSKILGSEEFTIQVAPIIIEELDDKKYHKNERIAKRANLVLNKLEQGVKFVNLLSDRIDPSLVQKYSLNREKNDDQLLASIISFQQKTHDSCVLITNDTGPRLKAKSLGIKAINIPDNLRIRQDDPKEEELSKVKRELQKLRDRLPKLEITFSNNQEHMNFKINSVPTVDDKTIKLKIDSLKNEYSYLQSENDEKPFQFKIPLSQDQIEGYNKSLSKFLDNYENYLKINNDYNIKIALTYRLDFAVRNVGTEPAINVEPFFHFPDGFAVMRERDLPQLQREPKPPYKPKSIMDFKIPSFVNPAISIPSISSSPLTTNFNEPIIRRTKSYEVEFPLGDLKHNLKASLDPIFIRFESIEDIKNFNISYILLVDNLPDPVKGQLNVRFNNNSK